MTPLVMLNFGYYPQNLERSRKSPIWQGLWYHGKSKRESESCLNAGSTSSRQRTAFDVRLMSDGCVPMKRICFSNLPHSIAEVDGEDQYRFHVRCNKKLAALLSISRLIESKTGRSKTYRGQGSNHHEENQLANV